MVTPTNSEFGGNEFGGYEFGQDVTAFLNSGQVVSASITADLSTFVQFDAAVSISQAITADLTVSDFEASLLVSQSVSADIAIGNTFVSALTVTQVIVADFSAGDTLFVADLSISQLMSAAMIIGSPPIIPISVGGFDTGILLQSTPYLMQQTWNDAAVKFVSSKIDIADMASLGASLLAEWKVNSVVLFQMQADGFTAFGSHVPKARIHGSESTIVGVATSAVSDGDLNASEVNFWLDEVGSELEVKVKDSGGVVKSGVIAVS